MTDRELLELAAKAAGMLPGRYADGWHYVSNGHSGDGLYKLYPFQSPIGNRRLRSFCWNPLTDDVDALRLSADLDIFGGPSYWHWLSIARLSGSTDKYANVRYAITRAAAEIGRTMK